MYYYAYSTSLSTTLSAACLESLILLFNLADSSSEIETDAQFFGVRFRLQKRSLVK